MAIQRYLENEAIAIAQGRVLGTSSVNKFGFTGADIGVSTVETVWDGNGTTEIYPYPSNGVAAVTDNTTDTGEVVVVEGLDADYNPRSTTIPVGAASPVVFSRIFRAFMESTPNGADVDITIGGALAARIKAGLAQTEMALYTIPAGKQGFLMNIHGSTTKSTGNPACQFRIKVREFSSVFRIKGQFGTAGGQSFMHEYPIPLFLPEKSDIRIDVVSDAATGAGAIFDIILVDN